jgi:hypothetical protein
VEALDAVHPAPRRAGRGGDHELRGDAVEQRLGDVGGQLARRDAAEDGRPDPGVGVPRIEQHRARQAQAQRRRVQVAQAAQPLLLAQALGPGQQRPQQGVQQIERLVEGGGLQDPREGQQRGHPAVVRHPGEHGRPGAGSGAGERLQAAGRHATEIELADSQRADLDEPIQGPDQTRGAHTRRGAAEPIEGAHALTRRHQQQPLQPSTVRGTGRGGQRPPQARGGAVAHAGDRAARAP